MTKAATPDIPRDPRQEVVVPVDALTELLVKMYVRKGMYRAEAEIGVARLIEADLRGIHSHGSRAIGKYLQAMDSGDIDPRAQILTETDTPAMAVLDGGTGLGHVAATKAMQTAIEKARQVGTGTVVVKRSQHLGATGVYAQMAADAGMIGYCTTNTGPVTVAAYGSSQPAVANNAFAWGIPSRNGPPVVLDMACAVAAWGKVETMKLYGQELPANWALDEDGQPTTDPHAAKTLQPAAGPRGYGLAFVASVLSGPLAGNKMPIHKTWAIPTEGSGHFFYAVDISQFADEDRFYAELDSAIAETRALPPADGFDRVRLPGELEAERAEAWRRDGLPLHRDHVDALAALAVESKLDIPWTN